jgi:hypothetical protein
MDEHDEDYIEARLLAFRSYGDSDEQLEEELDITVVAETLLLQRKKEGESS